AEAARWSPSFKIHPFLLCGHCGILIELPEPRRPAEAYFSAVVVHLPKSAEPRPAMPPPTWYFTLERTSDVLVALLSAAGNNRLVTALRANPRLLIDLLKETMFRGCFHRDLAERMLPGLERDPRFREIFPDLLRDPER